MNKISVIIANKSYTLSGEEDKDYILGLASYVDKQISDAMEKSPGSNNVFPVVLAAINIADQYFKQKEKIDELSEQLDKERFSKDEWDKRNSILIDEQNETIDRLYDRIQQLDNILVEKNKEIFDLRKDLEEKFSDNEKLNDLANQFQNDMLNLQFELMDVKKKLNDDIE